MIRLFTLIALVTILVGCATGPVHQNSTTADAACIKGGVANVLKYFSEEEVHVFISEIDGVRTGNGYKELCFASGKHTLVAEGHHVRRIARNAVDLNFEAGKKYLLRGNIIGPIVNFRLYELNPVAEAKVAEFKIPINSPPTYVPVTSIVR